MGRRGNGRMDEKEGGWKACVGGIGEGVRMGRRVGIGKDMGRRKREGLYCRDVGGRIGELTVLEAERAESFISVIIITGLLHAR
jgi:hypothetical protein